MRIGSHLSNFRALCAGVPRGSILSPILFNVMISDFPTPNPNVRTLMYADDVTIFCRARNNTHAEGILQPVLVQIETGGTR